MSSILERVMALRGVSVSMAAESINRSEETVADIVSGKNKISDLSDQEQQLLSELLRIDINVLRTQSPALLKNHKERKKAENLTRIRKSRGLTRKELAWICGFDVNVIDSYESGKRFINNTAAINVIKLADALNVAPEALLEFEE